MTSEELVMRNSFMSLSVGIVGLPNVGKSTLFNALLKKQQALAANYPFATIEPNVGIVPVPDARLAKLAEVVAMQRVHAEGGPGSKERLTYTSLPPIVPATVTFYDIAGLVKGASEGEGLGNKFLSHIRETDAICMVVRAFSDPDVVLTGSGEPKTDADIIMTELILADLQTIAKQVAPKGMASVEQKKRWEVIEKIRIILDSGQPAGQTLLTAEEQPLVRELHLLTMKPVMYVLNVDEAELSVQSVHELALRYAGELHVTPKEIIIVSAKIEAELADMAPDEQMVFLSELGFSASGLERLIGLAYDKLGLISFLTAGEKEVRAWTIRQGDTAQRASGVIHTDFMKKFIKADVAAYPDFVASGGWKGAREKGLVRSEGREYVMKDGEVVEFKIGS
jgi:ribosome-binding ATPase